MINLKFYQSYTAIGLKPIAVYKGTKTPVGANWNKNWTYEYWEKYFLNDDYNMGLLLGEIIDVEADTPEANDLLIRMIDNYPHPVYKSNRSIHHLFLTPDLELTKETFQGIEFRGFNHQSVIPPSIHETGIKYQWLENSNFVIPKLPEELLNFYLINKSNKSHKLFKRQCKRKRLNNIRTVCNKCHNKFYINKTRLILEVKAFSLHNKKWTCRGCRDINIKQDCKVIKNYKFHS